MGKGQRKIFLTAALAIALLLGDGVHEKVEKGISAMTSVRISERQLILDAGHGGEDGGAVSITGIAESTINLAITLKIDQLLGFYGISPILVRNSDISLHNAEANTLREKKVSDLKNRVALVEGTANGVLISIHQNTFTNQVYHGAQVFYRGEEESLALAAPGGRIVLIGNPNGPRTLSQTTYWSILRKQLTLTGTWNSSFGSDDSDWLEALKAMTAGRVETEKIVSHVLGGSQLMRGLNIMRRKTEPYSKIVMEWSGT